MDHLRATPAPAVMDPAMKVQDLGPSPFPSGNADKENVVPDNETPRKRRWTSAAPPWAACMGPMSGPTDVSPASSDALGPLRPRQRPNHPLPQSREDTPPVALAPFLPGISGGIWSPLPNWTATDRQVDDKEEQIRLLQERVDRLTLEKDVALNENARLTNEVHHLSSMVTECHFSPPPPPLSVAPRTYDSLPFSSSLPSVTRRHTLSESLYQSIGGLSGLPLHDPQPVQRDPWLSTAQDSGVYHPTQITVDLILSGKLDYMRLDPRSEYDLIRPLVWTIAHQEPRNNSQAATLKVGANALGGRLGQPRSSPITQFLVSVIMEWAKPLCFTSNGNYLCQQLLEKGTTEDKINFIKVIERDIVPIANNKFGAHVLVKAIGVKELESRISDALITFGIFESMQTGARKVWRPYLTKCRGANETEIFDKIMSAMKGRWADLSVSNENGSISVQQIFEGCANQALIDTCFQEILDDISRIANNQFGHFVINKLLNFHEPLIKAASHAILTAYPPLATNHHGVQFVEFVLSSSRILQRTHIVKYLESLCSQKDGRTPAIVAVANSSVGRGHLQSVLRQMPPGERALINRVHNTCRQFQTTLRNSQSGNELLRSLGIINTPARRN